MKELIITLKTVEDIKDAIENRLIDKEKYVCLIADDNTITIKPIVSTRGRDIFVLQKVHEDEIDKIEDIFPKTMRVHLITFREDNYQP